LLSLSDFIDQRFWSLIGVPFPQLPSDNPLQQQRQQQQQRGETKEDDRMDLTMENGNGNGNGHGIGSAAPAAVAPANATNAPPGFDAYSDLHVAYDLLLSDGRQQLKVVLSPTLAVHVEKGGIQQYGLIEVTEAGVRYDETVVAGPGIYVVKGMNILATRSNDLILADPAAPLSFPQWAAASDAVNKPLIGGPRSYYLSLYNDDTIYFAEENYPREGEGEKIAREQTELLRGGNRAAAAAGRAQPMHIDFAESKEEAAPRRGRKPLLRAPSQPIRTQDGRLEEPRVLTKQDIVSIKKLLVDGSSANQGDKSILCRVFAKSRILNFGRKSTLSRADQLRAPFSFELLVGDESEEQMKVVLWNTLVGAYFDRVHIGQIISLRGFRLKQARSDAQYELVLNPYNPIGTIRILQEQDAVEQSVGEGLPAVTMTISTVAVIRSMPDESYFDTAGVVTFVSPMLREWSVQKKQFYQFRWVTLVDESCTDALAVKIYTNSQQTQLEAVQVADVLYLSNLTLHSTNASTGANPLSRSVVATSTNYTQLLDQAAQVNTQHPYLLGLHRWASTVDHGELAMYRSLYGWSFDFEQYKQRFGDQITPMHEVDNLRQALRFQQTRSLLLQGFVTEVILHPAGLRSISQGTMDKEAYDEAMGRIYPQGEGSEAPTVAAGSASAPAAPAASAPSSSPSRGRAASAAPPSSGKKRGRKSRAEMAAELAAEASPELSQGTTISTRLRRSTRTDTLATEHDLQQSMSQPTAKRGRSKGTAAAAAVSSSQPTRSTSRGRKSSRSTSRKGGKGSRKAKRGRRSASAAAAAEETKEQEEEVQVGRATRRGGKVVKIVKKRKASRSATPAAPAAEKASEPATAAASAPSAEAAMTSVLSRSVPSGILPPAPPSSPSTLATITLRSLNGESAVQVDLTDPIQGWVKYEKTKGNVAEKCDTPHQAPRVSREETVRSCVCLERRSLMLSFCFVRF
jgi:hypothetical protein